MMGPEEITFTIAVMGNLLALFTDVEDVYVAVKLLIIFANCSAVATRVVKKDHLQFDRRAITDWRTYQAMMVRSYAIVYFLIRQGTNHSNDTHLRIMNGQDIPLTDDEPIFVLPSDPTEDETYNQVVSTKVNTTNDVNSHSITQKLLALTHQLIPLSRRWLGALLGKAKILQANALSRLRPDQIHIERGFVGFLRYAMGSTVNDAIIGPVINRVVTHFNDMPVGYSASTINVVAPDKSIGTLLSTSLARVTLQSSKSYFYKLWLSGYAFVTSDTSSQFSYERRKWLGVLEAFSLGFKPEQSDQMFDLLLSILRDIDFSNLPVKQNDIYKYDDACLILDQEWCLPRRFCAVVRLLDANNGQRSVFEAYFRSVFTRCVHQVHLGESSHYNNVESYLFDNCMKVLQTSYYDSSGDINLQFVHDLVNEISSDDIPAITSIPMLNEMSYVENGTEQLPKVSSYRQLRKELLEPLIAKLLSHLRYLSSRPNQSQKISDLLHDGQQIVQLLLDGNLQTLTNRHDFREVVVHFLNHQQPFIRACAVEKKQFQKLLEYIVVTTNAPIRPYIPCMSIFFDSWLSRLTDPRCSDQEMQTNIGTFDDFLHWVVCYTDASTRASIGDAYERQAYVLRNVHETLSRVTYKDALNRSVVLPPASSIDDETIDYLQASIVDALSSHDEDVYNNQNFLTNLPKFIRFVLTGMLPEAHGVRLQNQLYLIDLLGAVNRADFASRDAYTQVNFLRTIASNLQNVVMADVADMTRTDAAWMLSYLIQNTHEVHTMHLSTSDIASLARVVEALTDPIILSEARSNLNALAECFTHDGTRYTLTDVGSVFAIGSRFFDSDQGVLLAWWRDNASIVSDFLAMLLQDNRLINDEKIDYFLSVNELLKVSSPLDEVLVSVFEQLVEVCSTHEGDDLDQSRESVEVLLMRMAKCWLIDDEQPSNTHVVGWLNSVRRHTVTQELVQNLINSQLDKVSIIQQANEDEHCAVRLYATKISRRLLNLPDDKFKSLCKDICTLQGADENQRSVITTILASPYFTDVVSSITDAFSDQHPKVKPLIIKQWFAANGWSTNNDPVSASFYRFCNGITSYFYYAIDKDAFKEYCLTGNYLLAINLLMDGLLRPNMENDKVQKYEQVVNNEMNNYEVLTQTSKPSDMVADMPKALSKHTILPNNAAGYICSVAVQRRAVSKWFVALLQVVLSTVCCLMAPFFMAHRKEFSTNFLRIFKSLWFMLSRVYLLVLVVPLTIGLVLHLGFGAGWYALSTLSCLPTKLYSLNYSHIIASNMGAKQLIALLAGGVGIAMALFTATPLTYVALSSTMLWFLPVCLHLFTRSPIKAVFTKTRMPIDALSLKPHITSSGKKPNHSYAAVLTPRVGLRVKG